MTVGFRDGDVSTLESCILCGKGGVNTQTQDSHCRDQDWTACGLGM